MSKQLKGILIGIGIVAVIIFVLYVVAVNSVFSNGGYEKGGHILFVNKANPQILVLKQVYLTGAWDGETTYRTATKNLATGASESIDTSTLKKKEWISIKVPYAIWASFEDHGFFSRERFKEFFTDFNNKGLLKFSLGKQKSFKELKLSASELPLIEPLEQL